MKFIYSLSSWLILNLLFSISVNAQITLQNGAQTETISILSQSSEHNQHGRIILSQENGTAGTIIDGGNGAVDGGGEINLYNPQGVPTLQMKAQGVEGIGNSAFIQLRAPNGENTAYIIATRSFDRGSEFVMESISGTPTVRVLAEEAVGNGAVLKLYNSAGVQMIELDAENGNGGAALLDLNGKVITDHLAVGTRDVPNGYRLAVDGNIISERVRVRLSGNWPDYVFAKDYPLLNLKELEQYIQSEGHLPNVPSASEVGEEGVDLGDMQRILLEKVEELTLHIIQLNKEVEELQLKSNTKKSDNE